MKLPASIDSLREKVDGIPLRQRALLALALVAGTYAIFDALMIRPQSERLTTIQRQLEQADSRAAEFTASVERLAANASVDPNAELEQRLRRLDAQIERLENELVELDGGLARPDDALLQLRQLLAPNASVELETLEKLPPESLVIEGSDQPTAWVHRFRVVIHASWGAALDYLAAVEAMPSGLYLDTLTLQADGSTQSRIELVFYTITLGEGWLDV